MEVNHLFKKDMILPSYSYIRQEFGDVARRDISTEEMLFLQRTHSCYHQAKAQLEKQRGLQHTG